MIISIEVRFQVKGKHCWPDAPDAVAFLRNPHRHTFHFRIRIAVQHGDRDVEFITLRDLCCKAVTGRQQDSSDFGTQSCEQLAGALGNDLRRQGYVVTEIGVSEDGEFEGIVQWS